MIAAVAALIIYLWHRGRVQKRTDMEQYFSNAQQYIESDNFTCERECAKALEQAQKQGQGSGEQISDISDVYGVCHWCRRCLYRR